MSSGLNRAKKIPAENQECKVPHYLRPSHKSIKTRYMYKKYIKSQSVSKQLLAGTRWKRPFAPKTTLWLLWLLHFPIISRTTQTSLQTVANQEPSGGKTWTSADVFGFFHTFQPYYHLESSWFGEKSASSIWTLGNHDNLLATKSMTSKFSVQHCKPVSPSTSQQSFAGRSDITFFRSKLFHGRQSVVGITDQDGQLFTLHVYYKY